MALLRRTNQGGSAAVFVIVGIILALGLVVAVYFLKQHGDQVRNEQTIASSDKKQTETDKTAKSDDKKSSTTNSDKNKATDSTASSGDSSGIPLTGPSDTFVRTIGAGLLVTMMMSYILSRRELAHHL